MRSVQLCNANQEVNFIKSYQPFPSCSFHHNHQVLPVRLQLSLTTKKTKVSWIQLLPSLLTQGTLRFNLKITILKAEYNLQLSDQLSLNYLNPRQYMKLCRAELSQISYSMLSSLKWESLNRGRNKKVVRNSCLLKKKKLALPDRS